MWLMLQPDKFYFVTMQLHFKYIILYWYIPDKNVNTYAKLRNNTEFYFLLKKYRIFKLVEKPFRTLSLI